MIRLAFIASSSTQLCCSNNIGRQVHDPHFATWASMHIWPKLGKNWRLANFVSLKLHRELDSRQTPQ